MKYTAIRNCCKEGNANKRTGDLWRDENIEGRGKKGKISDRPKAQHIFSPSNTE